MLLWWLIWINVENGFHVNSMGFPVIIISNAFNKLWPRGHQYSLWSLSQENDILHQGEMHCIDTGRGSLFPILPHLSLTVSVSVCVCWGTVVAQCCPVCSNRLRSGWRRLQLSPRRLSLHWQQLSWITLTWGHLVTCYRESLRAPHTHTCQEDTDAHIPHKGFLSFSFLSQYFDVCSVIDFSPLLSNCSGKETKGNS